MPPILNIFVILSVLAKNLSHTLREDIFFSSIVLLRGCIWDPSPCSGWQGVGLQEDFSFDKVSFFCKTFFSCHSERSEESHNHTDRIYILSQQSSSSWMHKRSFVSLRMTKRKDGRKSFVGNRAFFCHT